MTAEDDHLDAAAFMTVGHVDDVEDPLASFLDAADTKKRDRYILLVFCTSTMVVCVSVCVLL